MKKILIINGPNINLLGQREVQIYGNQSYKDLVKLCNQTLKSNNLKGKIVQTNSESEIIDLIQRARSKYDAIIINPAGYTHTSIAILDSVLSCGLGVIVVHISDPDSREEYRKVSYIEDSKGARRYLDKSSSKFDYNETGYIGTIKGYGLDSYKMAIEFLA